MKIVIPGIPVCQLRMKFVSKNGFGRAYDPRDKQKKEIRAFIGKVCADKPKFSHPRVSFVFHMPIPKSIPKKKRFLYDCGLLKHEKKPDVDNFIKLYLDCMDDIFFDGDQKVSLGYAVKLYHPEPKTIIILHETTETLNPLEVDPLIWCALFGQECGRCSYAEISSLPDSYTPDQLESQQCDDMMPPGQKARTSEPAPSVHEILARATQASKQFSCQPP